jgi:hypothetical protein
MGNLLLLELLGSLFFELEKCKSPLVHRFNKGISEMEISGLIMPLELSFPQPLVEYFQWKDGLIREGLEDIPLAGFNLFPFGSPFSLKEAVEIFQYYAIDHGHWGVNFFPVFESGLGDYLLLDINEASPTSGMVCFSSPADPNAQGVVSYADSLNRLIEAIIECYQKEVYYFTEFEGHRILEEHYDAGFNIWKNNNPRSEYWKIVEASWGLEKTHATIEVARPITEHRLPFG